MVTHEQGHYWSVSCAPASVTPEGCPSCSRDSVREVPAPQTAVWKQARNSHGTYLRPETAGPGAAGGGWLLGALGWEKWLGSKDIGTQRLRMAQRGAREPLSPPGAVTTFSCDLSPLPALSLSFPILCLLSGSPNPHAVETSPAPTSRLGWTSLGAFPWPRSQVPLRPGACQRARQGSREETVVWNEAWGRGWPGEPHLLGWGEEPSCAPS